MRAGAEIESPGLQSDRRFSPREAAQILEVPEARLRALARAGFQAPHRGPMGALSFGFQDLLILRTTKGLLEAGVPMRRIRRVWTSLREQLASGVPLTSITIRADGEEVVASGGGTRWQPDSGQLLLDFETSEIAERARAGAEGIHLAAAPSPAPAGAESDPGFSAEQWYEMGCELEASSPVEARAAYEKALELDPGVAGAHVNLGRLLHKAGELGRAEPHYREAVALDPDDPTPHFNLGALFEELGRREDAILAYRQAILRDPDFADAHCNLGLLLESLGRRQEAVRHLMAARRLSGEPE